MDEVDGVILAKQELYNLGRQAEEKLNELEETRNRATWYRLHACPGNAGFEMLQAGQIERELASIGKRQTELMDFLVQQGEAFYL